MQVIAIPINPSLQVGFKGKYIIHTTPEGMNGRRIAIDAHQQGIYARYSAICSHSASRFKIDCHPF
jgi:hypothetical protein